MNIDDKLAFSVPTFVQAVELSRATVYRAIKEGALITRRLGSRTVILREDAQKFLQSLPVATLDPNRAPKHRAKQKAAA